MSCLIQRNKETGRLEKVMAPNGEESLLYRDIEENLTKDYELGKEVILAKESGLIPDYSDAEVALVLWSQWHTNPAIKERMEEEGKTFLDENGEPAFASINDLLGLRESEEERKGRGRIGMEGLIKFLRQQELIYKENGKFRLSEEATLPNEHLFKSEEGAAATNEERIRQALSWFGLPEKLVTFKKTGNGTTLQFNASQLPGEHVQKAQDESNTSTLVTFLRDRFPQLKMEFVSEKKAEGLYNEYQQKLPAAVRGKLDFERVNSFIHKGTIYLINGRVNNQVAIEEVLHPFIYTLSKSNSALFNSLRDAALKEFPNLSKSIETNYVAQAGFTDEDREQELVTQAVARTFAKEYEQQPPRSILKLLNELKEWFAKLVESFGAFVGGNKRLVIDVSKLPSDITLTGIAQLLNTYDSKFLVDTTAPGFNFSISEEKSAFFKKILEQANPLQEKIIKDLIKISNETRFDEAGHVYTGEDGKVYTSMTTAMNGKFDDDKGLYVRNILFGNEFDAIMEGLVLGKTFDQIKDKVTLNPDIAARAYRELQQFVFGLNVNGNIIVPQLRIADPKSGIAGTMDLLLIRPDGSMMIIDLKTSYKSARAMEYSSVKYATKEGSRLPGESLSKGQTHGIQVGGYNKLMEVNGYYPDNPITYHMLLNIEGTGANQKVVGFESEGSLEHSPVANKKYIDKIIPTAPGGDKVRKYKRKMGMLSEASEVEINKWDAEFRESEDFKGTMESLTVAMEEFREKARKRIDRLEMVRNAASFSSTQDSIHKLSELLLLTGQDLSRGQADRAFGTFLNHTKRELKELIEYMSDTTQHDTDEFVRRVLDAGNYIETYRGMVNAPEWTLGNRNQDAMLKDVLSLLNVANNRVRKSLENYILKVMKSTSRNEISDEQWRVLIREGTDISRVDLYAGDIDTSTDPLVAVAAKLYKHAMLEAHARSSNFEERIYEMGNKLYRLSGGKPDFKKWMIETDENGKMTGRYVQEIGAQFWKLRNEKLAKLKDSEGKIMQYRKVYVGDGIKNEEDIAYNKRLMELKKEYREFQQAEIQGEGGVSDGNFYKYSQEFKDERLKNEEYKAVILDGKFVRGSWVKRSDVGYEEYRQYQLKYYNFGEKYDTAYYENGEFTGELMQGTGSGRFVKNDYIEIRPITGDGTDMRSAQWLRLQNATDEEGIAMKEFYDVFIKEMKETLKMLPLSTEKEMLGELPRVRGNFIDRAKQSESFFKAAARTAGKWFSVRTQAKESLYNEDGSPMNSIPVFYKGHLRDEVLIEKLQEKLDQLEKDRKEKKIEKAEYLKDKERLINERRIAMSAVSADELETDMVQSLLQFRSKAESFKAMHDIEASLLAVQEMLTKRKYRRKLSSGEFQTEKGAEKKPREIKGENSRTLERFKEWMQMTFYHSEDIDMGKADVLAKKLMEVASISSVGIGSFGAIHNYAMARINTAIETWGGRFYDKSAGFRAVKAFNDDFLIGLFHSDPGSKDDYYKTKKGRSKYEAIVNLFNITRKQESGEGRPDNLSSFLLYGYKFSELGEYSAQSKSGIAYLMTKTLKKYDKDGKEIDGKEIPVYDAFDYDGQTGKLTLKDGYRLDEKQKHAYTNEIWEMNKQMHGSYAWEDRMVIQKYTLGKLAVQFHKWIYPMFKARFKARYFDENLGEMEGRYRTVWQFIKYLREMDGTLRERAYSAWKGMKKDQVQNMYRNAAELSFLLIAGASYMMLRGVSEGLSPDDDRLKRFVNFLRWESSKDIMEIKFWIPGVGISDQMQMLKNPFAAGTTFTRFASVLSEGADIAWPFNNSSMYYENGPYKGDLKLGKKITNLLPVTKELNKWDTFSQVSNFFIQ